MQENEVYIYIYTIFTLCYTRLYYHDMHLTYCRHNIVWSLHYTSFRWLIIVLFSLNIKDLDCDDQSTTTGALSNSNVQFTQETFSNWVVYSDQDANYAIRE